MVAAVLKRIAAQMPESIQHELRRMYFRRQIRRGAFFTDEQEYALLDRFLRPGDWVIDVGANVGHYTLRMSGLVGKTGRVIAIEPMGDTFALLAENVRQLPHPNVTLLNCAASDVCREAGMAMPKFDDGLANYYQARIDEAAQAMTMLTVPMDVLPLPRPVSLVKIDVEGHELPVLRGMQRLVERDRPVLIVETNGGDTAEWLESMGYASERLLGSSNVLCRAVQKEATLRRVEA